MNRSSFDSNKTWEQPSSTWFILLVFLPLAFFSMQFFLETFFPNEVSKGSEARQYLSAVSKAQIVNFFDQNSFVKTWDRLETGLKPETAHFQYSMKVTETAVFTYGIPKSAKFKAAVAAVFVDPNAALDPQKKGTVEQTPFIICEAIAPGIVSLAKPIYDKGKIYCNKGTERVN